MAKIDTSKIPNYDKMTDAEKIAALEAYEEESGNESEIEKLKKLMTKANTEAAEYKRKLREKQTDEEAAKAEREAHDKELQDKYDALLKKQTIQEYTEKYRKMGYDEKLALETATAMVDGDLEKVFANGETFRTNFEKNIRAEVTKSTPKPNNGNGGVEYKSKADIMKIQDATERQQAIADNIDLFKI